MRSSTRSRRRGRTPGPSRAILTGRAAPSSSIAGDRAVARRPTVVFTRGLTDWAVATAGTAPTGSGGYGASLDHLVGGPGLRRGRRDPERLAFGEALDFWRVTAVEADRRLALRAEMKLPGEALLEFADRALPARPRGSPLSSRPRASARAGCSACAYWYAVMPLHSIVFGRMLRGVRRVAEALAAVDSPADRNPRSPASLGGHASPVVSVWHESPRAEREHDRRALHTRPQGARPSRPRGGSEAGRARGAALRARHEAARERFRESQPRGVPAPVAGRPRRFAARARRRARRPSGRRRPRGRRACTDSGRASRLRERRCQRVRARAGAPASAGMRGGGNRAQALPGRDDRRARRAPANRWRPLPGLHAVLEPLAGDCRSGRRCRGRGASRCPEVWAAARSVACRFCASSWPACPRPTRSPAGSRAGARVSTRGCAADSGATPSVTTISLPTAPHASAPTCTSAASLPSRWRGGPPVGQAVRPSSASSAGATSTIR